MPWKVRQSRFPVEGISAATGDGGGTISDFFGSWFSRQGNRSPGISALLHDYAWSCGRTGDQVRPADTPEEVLF